MKNQAERIAEFLDKLTDSSLPIEQQILLFSQEESVDGAGSKNNKCTNKSNCTNTAKSCEGSINGGCKNYDENCNDSINTICENRKSSK